MLNKRLDIQIFKYKFGDYSYIRRSTCFFVSLHATRNHVGPGGWIESDRETVSVALFRRISLEVACPSPFCSRFRWLWTAFLLRCHVLSENVISAAGGIQSDGTWHARHRYNSPDKTARVPPRVAFHPLLQISNLFFRASFHSLFSNVLLSSTFLVFSFTARINLSMLLELSFRDLRQVSVVLLLAIAS